MYNKEKLLETINEDLKTAINGDIRIGGLNFTVFEKFPAFSISLSDVYLRGPRYAEFHKDFFNAEKIYIDIRLRQLLVGTIKLESIRIKNGNVFIFRASDRYTNMDIFKKKDKADTVKGSGFKPTLDLQKISFENTRCLYFDSVNRKSYGINFNKASINLTTTDSSRQIAILGDVEFAGLMLNEQKGSYLLNKQTHANLNVEVVRGTSGMKLLPSELQFEKSTIELSGQFNFAAPGSFKLNIHSPNLDYQEGTTIVTKALESKLGKFHLDKPVDLTVRLDGSLGGGEPKIDMKFATSGNNFSSGKIELNQLSFEGGFINHVDSTVEFGDPNSRLWFDKLTAKISGIPTDMKASISNLNDPDLFLDSHARLPLSELNSRTDTTRIKFLSGQFNADVKYSGKLMEYLDPTRTKYEGKLEGLVTVDNAIVALPLLQKQIDKGDISIHFTGEQMDIEKIYARVNGNELTVKGMVTGFIPYFTQPEKKGYVNLSIHASRIDLARWIKKKIASKQKKRGPKSNKKISDLFDLLYEKVEFEIDLKVDQMVKGEFSANNVEGKVNLLKGQFSASPLKLKTAGGSVSLAVQMADLDKVENEVTIKADVIDADMKILLKSFDNFSQKSITSDNLSGKVSTKVRLKGTVDEQFKLKLATLSGNIDLNINKGNLKNFEPLENMSNFLFKNRDFSNVDFAEIKTSMDIRGPSVTIHRMEIQSSVIFLFVEGVYSMAGETDMSIQVPLKNMKKRKNDVKPENVGIDAKVGPSIFLRVHNNKDGKMVFSYDPLKKLKKKK